MVTPAPTSNHSKGISAISENNQENGDYPSAEKRKQNRNSHISKNFFKVQTKAGKLEFYKKFEFDLKRKF